MHTYELEIGQIVKIGGIPYRYIGDGKIEGRTAIEVAKESAIGSCSDPEGATDAQP